MLMCEEFVIEAAVTVVYKRDLISWCDFWDTSRRAPTVVSSNLVDLERV